MDAQLRDDGDVTRAGKWPCVIQAILQFLGIFHGGIISQKTMCYMCKEKKEDVHQDLNQEPVNVVEEEYSCDVCKSLQWNSEGKMVAYDHNDIVSGVFNHRLSRPITIFSTLLISGAMCYDLITQFGWLWGKPDMILHLVSLLTFWLPLLSVPGCCLIAHACNVAFTDSSEHWFGVFNPNFIVRRLQFLPSLNSKRLVPSTMFLALCFAWAFANTGLEVLNFYRLFPWYHKDALNYMHLLVTTVSLLMFACFCYLLHLLRDSLDFEYNQVLAFILKHQDRVDMCRHRIVELFRDYRILRKVVRTWMILILSCATLGLTVHVSWNYTEYTRLRSEDDSYDKYSQKLHAAWMNILIGSEKFMILFLPLLALGGFNIENSWKQFRHAICIFRVDMYDSFWKKMHKTVYEIHPPFSSATVTIAWCVFGWFFGLHLGEQNTNYNSTPIGL